MSTDLLLSPALASLVEQAKDYAAAAQSENTARAYDADWRRFAGWRQRQGVVVTQPLNEAAAPVSEWVA